MLWISYCVVVGWQISVAGVDVRDGKVVFLQLPHMSVIGISLNR